MGEALIIQKSTRFSATIEVTYSGGTCTCTLDDETYTHSGGGTAIFTVKNKGMWTVIATDSNGITDNEYVNISKNNEVKSVTLSYVFNIISGNVVHSACGSVAHIPLATNTYESNKTTVSTTKGSSSITFTGGDSNSSSGRTSASVAYSKNAIDLTNYKTLSFTGSFTVTDRSGSWVTFGVLSATPTTSSCNWASSKKLTASVTSSTTYTIDVSSLNGKYHIGFMRNYRPGSATYSKVVLT